MKAISASIIVLAGCIVFGLGGLAHGDAQTTLYIFGALVTLLGFWGWFYAYLRSQ